MTHEILDAIARYREAARRIVHRPGPLAGPTGKCLAIVGFVRLIDAEPEPVLRAWAREAVWLDVRELLGWRAQLDDPTPPLRHDERVRLMVRAGYRRCPCCGEPMKPGAWRAAS